MVKQAITPKDLRQMFVARATERFASNVPDFVRLRQMVEANGGQFLNDHGAIRTADPELCKLFVRAAALMGLQREYEYAFPSKKLVSFDLQVIGEDAHQFKIFVSEVDLTAFPAEVAALIAEDAAEQADAVDHREFIALINNVESGETLDQAQAQSFVTHFVDRLMNRNGPAIKRSTLDAVAAVSGEAASALALGPDFNHVTIDVLAAGYAGIDQMIAAMRDAGFAMLPGVQGAVGTKLRQTATMAATMETPVREADGRPGVAQTEKQFVEIIERGAQLDEQGQPLLDSHGEPLIYRNFLAANAERIFDAASTRYRPATKD